MTTPQPSVPLSQPSVPLPAPRVPLPEHSVHLTVSAAQAGERIDRLLASLDGALSRSRIKTLIEQGAVTRLDRTGAEGEGRRVTEPAEIAHEGAVYRFTIPPAVDARPVAQAIPFPILFEDRDLIVLDKPAGLVVHPAPGNLDGTLVNALLAHCGPGFTGIGAEKRPGIVHRLDKDTSGVMVVAKTQLANDALTAAFAARDLDRAYIALCWGLPLPLKGEIEGAIGRDKRDRKRMAVVGHGGKAALTRYQVMRAFGVSVSLVSCRLATGRTHQIRVHMSDSGHPIVGDPLYLRRIPAVSRGVPAEIRRVLLDFPRQALHAASLGFAHPRTGEKLAFETPVPDDMAALIRLVEANLSAS